MEKATAWPDEALLELERGWSVDQFIDVKVTLAGNTPGVSEDPIRVTHSGQTIRWRPEGNDWRVAILFDEHNEIKGAKYRVLPDGSAELSDIPTGNFGLHKYTVVVFRKGMPPAVRDPDVIVKY